MPNFVQISFQIKKFFIQKVNFDRSVYMSAISYCDPMWTVPTNEQLLGEEETCAKFEIDISKTEVLVCDRFKMCYR